MRQKLAVCVLAIAGCSSESIVDPSPNPPPSWGVPITGGTMLVSRDGAHAVVADPDRDRIQIVDLDALRVTAELALSGTDEPGRIVEDGAGRFHVALRRGGALLTLTPKGEVAFRRTVCAAPRGVAWQSANDQVHVACATGELVSFPAAGGDAVRSLRIDRDLRDVLVDGAGLVVTRFRTAEMIRLDAQGAIASRALPPTVKRLVIPNGGFGEPGMIESVDTIPAVAWRAIQVADGRIVVSHQRQIPKQLGEHQQGGYGNPGCGGGDDGPSEAATTVLPPVTGAPTATFPLVHGALPVDLAQSPNGQTIAVVVAGAQRVHLTSVAALASQDDHDCDDQRQDIAAPIDDQLGTPTSVGYRHDGALIIFYPEVPALVAHVALPGKPLIVPLGGALGYDSGRALFHRQTQVGLACASCHPEGLDDGLVWNFQSQGLRRTQNLAGGILQRAPYHWIGDMTDLPKLMNDVFAIRMAGGTPTRSEQLSLGPWLDRIPAPAAAPVLDAAAVGRGKTIFESAATGCVTCHNGPLLTNKAIVAVGTNGTFKVPSLVGVGARAPFMHDGSAKTLLDRFGPTGGGDLHGHTSQLSSTQVADLVAFLESL